MKFAVIGSRTIHVADLGKYLPEGCTEIVSGGAIGVDRSAAEFAAKNALKLTEFLPQYDKYGRGAPIQRNKQVVEYADAVLAFWDGKSKGTFSVIQYCEKTGKPCTVILLSEQER